MSTAITTSVLDVSPVIPVVVIEDVSTAVPLARALLAGGVPIIEVTLRSASALDAIRTIAAEVPDMLVGAGRRASRGRVGGDHTPGGRGTTRSRVP